MYDQKKRVRAAACREDSGVPNKATIETTLPWTAGCHRVVCIISNLQSLQVFAQCLDDFLEFSSYMDEGRVSFRGTTVVLSALHSLHAPQKET